MSDPEIIAPNEDRVLVDGDVAVPILANGCAGCVFESMGISKCIAVPCCGSERADGNSVIWVYE